MLRPVPHLSVHIHGWDTMASHMPRLQSQFTTTTTPKLFSSMQKLQQQQQQFLDCSKSHSCEHAQKLTLICQQGNC